MEITDAGLTKDTTLEQKPRYIDPYSGLREDIDRLYHKIGKRDEKIGAQRSEIAHLRKQITKLEGQIK